jgi:hypothetical protein
MYYRFKNGVFVKADTFEEAKLKLIQEIADEPEDPKQWHECTCLGFDHRFDCPVKLREDAQRIPF